MSYQNFIPTVWAEGINRELERAHVFVADCNKQYEGQVKERGDSVRILGVGKPTISATTSKDITLGEAETVEDTAVTMPIKQLIRDKQWAALWRLFQKRRRKVLPTKWTSM